MVFSDKDSSIVMRLLLHPLLLASVLLHGLLLALPWPDSTPPPGLSAQNAPEADERAIATVRLEDLLAPTAVASRPEPPPATPAPLGRSQPPPPRPAEAEEFLATIDDVPLAAPGPESGSESGSESGPDPAFTPPVPPPPAGVEPSGPLQTLLTSLQGATTPTVAVTPEMLAQPDAFFDGLSAGNWRYKPNILSTALVPEQSPSQVFINLLMNSRESGFRSTQQADYGSGLVYEVVRQNQRWFFNLVPTRDGLGTAIVVWAQVPN